MEKILNTHQTNMNYGKIIFLKIINFLYYIYKIYYININIWNWIIE